MRTQHNRLESFVGFFVLIVAIYFLYIGYSSNHKSIQETYRVYAIFDRIDGLNIGSDVKVSGIKVGYIKDFYVDSKTYQAKVEFVVRKNLRFPKDSSAAVESESLLGGKYLSIRVGSDSAFLQENEVILDTQSSLNIESLMGKYLFSGNEKKN